ncbi:RCC1 domain-containing protein [Bradymonas sediminis]|uniref:non-specific serine/threonine protein kinase n=1 Tax=Bradymonas sediminis TaxID=1548548 RepID=A0A2Z4FK67_9DELT|nr:hypothetical protein DN745_07920 [Bradymonas sediminis]
MACWGDPSNYGAESQQNPEFLSVAAGYVHTCAIRRQHAKDTVTCWGQNGTPPRLITHAGEFSAVAAGRDHSCALTPEIKVLCRGKNDKNQLRIPDGLLEL